MNEKMNCDAPALAMKNGLESSIRYDQHFVQAANPNKAGPTNHAARMTPSCERVMKGIYRS